MSRTMPTECEHGQIVDWGDFGSCEGCDDHGGPTCPNVRKCPACKSRIFADSTAFLAALDRAGDPADTPLMRDVMAERDALCHEIEALRSVLRVVGMDLDVEDGVGLPHPWLVLHPNGCITAKRKITADQADAVRRALTTEGDTP